MSCYAIRDAIIRLNPDYHHQRILHLITTFEFPWLTQHALDLAVLNLMDSLEVQAPAGKDTFYLSELMLEVMSYGYSSSQGMEALKKIDGLFSLWDLNRIQVIQVFGAGIAECLLWYDRFGWRDVSDCAQEAFLQFWCMVGHRLRFANVSITRKNLHDAARQYLDARSEIQVDLAPFMRQFPLSQRPMIHLLVDNLREEESRKGLTGLLINGRALLIRETSKSHLKLPLQIPEITLRRGSAGD